MDLQNLLNNLNKEVELGNVSVQKKGDLLIYNYTRQCQYAEYWTEATILARGLIIDTSTMEIVGRGFSKFFNLNENNFSKQEDLPELDDPGVEVTTKADGSLGIIYFHDGDWQVATRGSFVSDQALWAKSHIDDFWHTPKEDMNREYSYLVEIVYPENRIVVDYGQWKGLILLSIVENKTGRHIPYLEAKTWAEKHQIPVVDSHSFKNYKELREIAASSKDNMEGWVIHFPSTGQRVKVKTDQYCKLFRATFGLSPLACWEAMADGFVSRDFIAEVAEELRPQLSWIWERLEEKHTHWLAIGYAAYLEVLPDGIRPKDKDERKLLAVKMKDKKYDDFQKAAVFCLLDGKIDNLNEFIKRRIRPKGNDLQ